MNMLDKELSMKEKDAIDELKRRIVDDVPPSLKYDKFLYLRFLREETGSLIEWEIEIDGKDIGFKLLYKYSNRANSTKELIPFQRIEAHPVSEVGSYYCEFPGTYIMVFDNSFSWITHKHVYYTASVVTPKAQEKSY